MDDEKITHVFLFKGFHLYSQRNEWVNWDGDTSLMNRSSRTLTGTLKEAKSLAETRRKRGTKFFIAEVPIISVVGTEHCLILSELFTDSPFSFYKDDLPLLENVVTIGELKPRLKTRKWSVCMDAQFIAFLTMEKEPYLFRRSRPRGTGKSLAWTYSTREINLTGVHKLHDHLSTLVEGKKVGDEIADTHG